MTSRQRMAFLILQMTYGYGSWSGALRLARLAALGSRNRTALDAQRAVRASLDAADAAMATIGTPIESPGELILA